MQWRPWLSKMHAVTLACLALALSGNAAAQTEGAEKSHELSNTSWTFLALESGTTGLLALTPSLLFDTPTRCKWCEPTAFDESVRNTLVAGEPKWVGYVSHGVSLGAVPLLAIGGSVFEAREAGHGEYALQDAWIITNAFLVTTAIGNTVKKNVARRRPAFTHDVGDRTEAVDFPDQQFLSFFSLDTAWAFSIAASGTTLAYLRGYESAPVVLAGGAVLATLAGVMRISADMHWATDVATGALVGTAVGVGLPLLMHRQAHSELETQVSPQGLVLSGVF
jgi:membrane-associated phospholipid phosphatase